MEQKIRVGAVNYLNTKPLIYGLQKGIIVDKIDLILDYPSKLTQSLQKDQLDIALLPVATIPLINNAQIISEYGIATNQQVASVCLFSHVPIEEIQEVYLDYQSRTSVILLQILLKEYWNLRPVFLQADEQYIDSIKDKKAGLIIGDRALENLSKFPYVYDLASAWFDYTKLPFVFAVWVANKEIDADFLVEFKQANTLGLSHLKEIAHSIEFPFYQLENYFENNIQYHIDEAKMNGLKMFLKMVEKMK